jgi:hypothetical protein
MVSDLPGRRLRPSVCCLAKSGLGRNVRCQCISMRNLTARSPPIAALNSLSGETAAFPVCHEPCYPARSMAYPQAVRHRLVADRGSHPSVHLSPNTLCRYKLPRSGSFSQRASAHTPRLIGARVADIGKLRLKVGHTHAAVSYGASPFAVDPRRVTKADRWVPHREDHWPAVAKWGYAIEQAG